MVNSFINGFFVFSMICIWFVVLYQFILAVSGYVYYLKIENLKDKRMSEIETFNKWPNIDIFVPAHNEEIVIEKTIKSLVRLEYPRDKMHIYIINDCSSDGTGEIVKKYESDFSGLINGIHTEKPRGGKGKSNALNIALEESNSDYIFIYDADNTPESKAVKLLIFELLQNKNYVAVIGKFRIRNRNHTLLTRFINLETLIHQWLTQAGRWQLFKMATIPGTNFVIKREILTKIGGWDNDAITEDTELSFRIFEDKKLIGMMPLAVSWQQDPPYLKVWMKQRMRWAKGNIYVLHKYLPKIFKLKQIKIFIDLIYYFLTYGIFFTAVILSDILFLLGIIAYFMNWTILLPTVKGNFFIVWILAYFVFVLQNIIILNMEKGEATLKNYGLSFLIYFTYCQLWIIITFKAFVVYTKESIQGKEKVWYKTERF